MSDDHPTGEEKLELLLNHNANLAPNQKPGWKLSITCCGQEVGWVRPREWTGTYSLAQEEIRKIVSWSWPSGHSQHPETSEITTLSRTRRQKLMRSTPLGEAITSGRWIDKPTDETDVPEVEWWRGRFWCQQCGDDTPARLDKLMAVAQRLADEGVQEINLRDLKWALGKV